MPDLTVAGLANVRDLGGLRRCDGSLTPSRVFLRAELLDRVTPAGWEFLAGYGVRTVLDLRRPDEHSGEVPGDVRSVRIDLDGADPEFWEPFEADGRWGTPLYYADHLARLPDRLAAVLRAIAAAGDGAILFHCGAGWDRTGLIAAVLLRAIDVTEDAAAADYLASFDNAETMATLHGRSFDVDARHAILARFGHTAESAFRDAYRNLDLDAWFSRARIDDATRVAVTTWRGTADRTPG